MAKKNIIWLASFPKSGNTWSRVFLGNYLLNRPRPMSLNDIGAISHGDARTDWYKRVAGGEIDPKNDFQTLALRPKVLAAITANGADVNLVKSHNQNDVASGHVLIPAELSRSAVYFVRNPLDVVLSYAAHFGVSHEGAAKQMADYGNTIGGNDVQVRQWTGSWSTHVTSWTDKAAFPIHVMRYEDMLDNPTQTFGAMIKALGIPLDNARLEKAIQFSSFNQVQAQEKISGFKEKVEGQEQFFRSGKSEQWRTELDPALIERIVNDHGKVMERYGYLP